jgi:hypothetical protein
VVDASIVSLDVENDAACETANLVNAPASRWPGNMPAASAVEIAAALQLTSGAMCLSWTVAALRVCHIGHTTPLLVARDAPFR